MAGFSAPPRLATDRLQLSTLALAELADYHRLHSDPLAHPHDQDAMHPDVEHSSSRIDEITADWRRDSLGYWAVRHESVFIGVAGARRSGYTDLNGQRRSDGSWNLYYRFFAQAWGSGYATEVMGEAVRCCQMLDPESTLRATIRQTNLGSKRVAEKLGMQLSHAELDLAGQVVEVYELVGVRRA